MGCCCLQRQNYSPENQGEIRNDSFTRVKQIYCYISTNNHNSAQSLMKIQAERFKQEGNFHFKNKKYESAINSYQKALNIFNEPIFHTNLALAYKCNHQYQKSIATLNFFLSTNQAKSHDNSVVIAKAKNIRSSCAIIVAKRYCLSNQFNIQENIYHINGINQTIQDLKEQMNAPNTNEKCHSYLQNARKLETFLKQNVTLKCKSEKLMNYLEGRLKKEGPQSTKTKKVREFYQSDEEIFKEMQNFSNLQKKNILQESDDEVIIDQITFEIFKKPMLSPSGITYQEQVLKKHFSSNGLFDPTTRQKFDQTLNIMPVHNRSISLYISEKKKHVTKDDIAMIVE